jgi:dihydrofolate synthase/folylpolyglutamate synthase
VILGLARDKDLRGILKAVSGVTDRVVCTSVGSDLHFTPQEIAEEAVLAGLAAETAANPRVALERALALARKWGWVVATGSLYLAGALRSTLTTADTPRRC